ncbi:hypothetical protein WBP07_11630 [Novosphingobium sp. BL-8A]|uniref:hypothetical protein n=1 Tax=Novosphingobium sp. BL-8A TaxID=3127639 RepID=UPI003756C9DD
MNGKIVRATVDVPAEQLLPGPRGYRVNVIDFDATANVLYDQADIPCSLDVPVADPYADADDSVLLADPRFHAQNVYAIVMRTLARFEFALGRRVAWGCEGHQLHIAPHAFAEANAFYSREDRAIFFGYFKSRRPDDATVFSCLSHDVIAHETTHAILDGLRSRFLEPSSPDQAGFHEGFSDVVALLSVFSLPGVVERILGGSPGDPLIAAKLLEKKRLIETGLFGLAVEMGQELSGVRGQALRRSVKMVPGKDYLNDPEYAEEHMRGEVLVAAMLHSFVDVWLARLERVGTIERGKKHRALVVEEGARAASHLLTMAIRAIDYCPTVDLSFADYLSALLTVDREVVPDDQFGYRERLLGCFAAFGITPSPNADGDGTWLRCDSELVYSRTHFDSMLRDKEEVFRFVWENRDALKLGTLGYIEVLSVRPSMRIAPDGFVLRETVAEYVQVLTLEAQELKELLGIDSPASVEQWRRIKILGGGALIFDEYGQLKYQIANHLADSPGDVARQSARIAYLAANGNLTPTDPSRSRIAALHLARSQASEAL